MISFTHNIINQIPRLMAMKKIALSILLGLFMVSVGAQAQTGFKAENVSGNSGSQVTVDFTTKDFNSVVGFEIELNWDESVATFASVQTYNNVSPFNENNFSFPPDIAAGTIKASFNNAGSPQTLADGQKIFSVTFNLSGAECKMTPLTYNSSSTFYIDSNFERQDMSNDAPVVNINGTDCGGNGGNEDELLVDAAEVAGPSGSKVCVPMTVKNFKAVVSGAGLGSAEGEIEWDQSIIQFDTIYTVDLVPDFATNLTNIDNGKMNFIWSRESRDQWFGLDDDATIFNICFDVIGSNGQTSPITLLNWEWADDTDDSNVIPLKVDNGSVTVGDAPAEKVELSIESETAKMGDEVCVDVSVKGFKDMSALEHNIEWDASVLRFKGIADGVKNMDLTGLNNQSWSYTDNSNALTLSWNDPNGVTKTNGSVIYTLCFDAIGDCGSTSAVSFVPNGNSLIIAKRINGAPTNLSASERDLKNGSVTVDCEKDCQIASITGSCTGAASGAVNTSIPAGGSCSWTDANGNVISTDCNLLGVGPGSYTLNVSFTDGKTCSLNATVPQSGGPQIAGTVLDATCSEGGSINVQITGTSGTPTVSWSDSGLGSSTNPTGLAAGSYTITVTDNSGCASSRTFEVEVSDADLNVSFTKMDVACKGEANGAIALNISNGCPPYEVSWTGGLSGENVSNIAAGSYTVTVKDASGQEKMATIEIMEPSKAITLDNQAITNSSGSDGAINLTVSGGTGTLSYAWSDGNLPNSNNVTGLSAGNYTVTVTDANGCTETFGPFNVLQSGGSTDITLTGNAAMCFGEKSGSVVVNVNGSSFPGTLEIKGPDTDKSVSVSNSSSITFDDLGAGEYEVTFTDAGGTEVSKKVTVDDADEFAFDIRPTDIDCSDKDENNGSIIARTVGGSGSLTYTWSDPDLSGREAKDLAVGDYTVIVEDANGCQLMETFTVASCSTPGPGCFTFPRILTPNGDGKNDRFNANCLRDYNNKLSVFDRWGNVVYEAIDYDGTWEGTNGDNGDLLNEGGYMYVLEVMFATGQREIVKGTVTILRD